MKLTFINGFMPLQKTFAADGTVLPYPNVKTLTSTSYETIGSVAEAFETIKAHAELGHALMRGHFTRALVNESRRGLSERDAPTQRITLDFDKISLPEIELDGSKYTSDTVRTVANTIIAQLPDVFHDVSYCARASSSFGNNKQFSLHVEMFLATPITPAELKQVLTGLNLTCDFLKEHIRLSKLGRSLLMALDPCLADNSRIVFIAPPKYDNPAMNPFVNNSERFVYEQRTNAVIDVAALLKAAKVDSCIRDRKKYLKTLQHNAGLSLPSAKHRTIRDSVDGRDVQVVINPPETPMRFHMDHGTYVTYNIGEGDSHAYFVEKDSPSVVRNWKGEEYFSFSACDRATYEWHLEQFGVGASSDDGEDVEAVMPTCFRDMATDTYFAGLFSRVHNKFTSVLPINKTNLDDFYTDFGGVMPSPVPQMTMVFDPQSNSAVDYKRRTVNTWQVPKLMTDVTGTAIPLESVVDRIKKDFPTIYKVLASITVDNRDDIERFVNWLAFIVQTREKAKTAWLFQGVQGTGKGLLFHRILKPIFEKYACMKHINNLDEQFNGWMPETLLCAIDEFRYDAKNKMLHQRLKGYITEDELPVRAMRTEQRQLRSFISFICFTNEYDPLPLEESDRRMNICARQERKLDMQHPDIMKEVETYLDEEVQGFADLLRLLKMNRYTAQTAALTPAKQRLLDLSQNSVDTYVGSLKNGRFDLYENILYQDVIVAGSESAITALAAKNTVIGWLKQMQASKSTRVKVTLEQMRLLYTYFTGAKTDSNLKMKKLAEYRGLLVDVHGTGRAKWQGVIVTFNVELDYVDELVGQLTTEVAHTLPRKEA